MDPPPPSPNPSLDLSAIPIQLLFPKLEPVQVEEDKTSSHGGIGALLPPLPVPFPNPYSGIGTSSLLSIPNPSPNPMDPVSDDELFDEYLRLFAARFRRPPGPPDGEASTAIVPFAGGSSSSSAIVPFAGGSSSSSSIVPAGGNSSLDVSSAVAVLPKKKKPRSAEMVRVSSLSAGEEAHLRAAVRRARITFESLRSLMDRPGPGLSPVPGGRGGGGRSDLKAAAAMASRDLWLNRDHRIIGGIPGIQVGDVFFYRAELCILGLHGQNQAGIDYVPAARTAAGEPVATSIISSGGYEDDEDRGDVLIYTGHGGRERNLVRHSGDQKLVGANLALERSMVYGIEIRVIRGPKSDSSPSGRVYVYDGLYRVVQCWPDVGRSGFAVYKYKLVRIEGQEVMGSEILKLAAELKANPMRVRPTGYLSLDLSQGKENLPVSVFNDIDDDSDPLLFKYQAHPIFPPVVFEQSGSGYGGGGCECVSNCSADCDCARRNGGEFAYDGNGFLLKGKPLIYECGTSCSCLSSCPNRVSQKGLKHRLEVFRSRETSWGVKSLDLIRAGSFICEFSGIVLTKEQTGILTMGGASLIYPSRFPARWYEWGDISDVYSDHVPANFPFLPDLNFSMDVSEVRNVACYLSHSCSPNVFVQFVLYDHYNGSYPHLMVFAMENIPPLRELSIDYGWG